MDTSTLIHTDSSDPDTLPASASLTSALHAESAQPGLEWLTRLIAPLTGHSSAVESEGPAPAASITPGVYVKMYDGQQPWTGQPGTLPAQTEADGQGKRMNVVLLVFIPILAVVLTVLLGLIVFLVAMLYMRRKRGVRLVEDGGPLDLSKSDGIIGEGGVDGVEARWLETVDPDVREAYRRAKEWQASYPPASVPSDITLSQFLSIQEKGVSAWSFEPDYEDNLSLYVQSRTEITFLSDGPGMPVREGGGNNVMANLPLPKLNEVYYWEVKMYDKPATTEVAIGLATRPYPSFRLPGWARHSVAYFASDGFRSHDYPFTATSYGPPLNEGDVLGVGYRPRTGTVFFTRNGRKLEDAYTGLQRFNLFPVIGANGPCTVHANLGQAGFVFIEANVKKWGLAPMVGTLAPPPAYGSERGSILLDAGYGTPGAGQNALQGVGALLEAARQRASGARSVAAPSPSSSPDSNGRPIPASTSPSTPRPHSSRRHRRAGKSTTLSNSIPAVPSPLRGEAGPGPSTAGSRRWALAVRDQEPAERYVSPTDTPLVSAPAFPSPSAVGEADGDGDETEDLQSEESGEEDESGQRAGSDGVEPESPMEHNPPTPNLLDISLHSLRTGMGQYFGREDEGASGSGVASVAGRGGEYDALWAHARAQAEAQAQAQAQVQAQAQTQGSGGLAVQPSSGAGSATGSEDTLRPPRRSPSGSTRSDGSGRSARSGQSGRSGQSQNSAGTSGGAATSVGGSPRSTIGRRGDGLGPPSGSPPPPGYAPLDPHMYATGLPADLPEDLVNQAIAAMSDAPNAGSQTGTRITAEALAGAGTSGSGQSRSSGRGWFGRG